MRRRERSHEGYPLNERERRLERGREGEGESNERINIERTNLSLHEVIWFPIVAFYRQTGKLHCRQGNQTFHRV